MRKALEGAKLDLEEVLLDQIVLNCPDERVRNVLDEEYKSWLPLSERHAPGPCPRPQRTGAQDRPRVRRRAQYAWVQREYNRNRSRCAQDVFLGCLARSSNSSSYGSAGAFLRKLQCPMTSVCSLCGHLSGSLWRLFKLRMLTDL